MPEHTTGTRAEWQTARERLAEREAAHARLTQEVLEERRRLPWVPVEKDYEFDTDSGTRSLA
jgi:predicted dithiol-disulfide oxidoreductase (DUF899 family)